MLVKLTTEKYNLYNLGEVCTTVFADETFIGLTKREWKKVIFIKK